MDFLRHVIFSKDGIGTNMIESIPGIGLFTSLLHYNSGNDKYAKRALMRAFGDNKRPQLIRLPNGLYSYGTLVQMHFNSNYSTNALYSKYYFNQVKMKYK